MAMTWPEPKRQPSDRLGSLAAWAVPPLVALVGAIGASTLYSVAGGSMEPWAMRHVTRMILGFALMLGTAMVPPRVWMGLAYPVYGLTLLAVVAVLLRGTQALGAQRWLDLGPVSLQPSEVMKLALILVLARYFHGLRPQRISHPLWVGLPFLLVAVPMLLIAKQPDLGTASLLGLTGLVMMFLAGPGLVYFAAGGAALACVLPLVWHFMHDYQRQRILVFLDPAIDPLGRGYQIYQSKIALGSGGFTGKGFLQGTQTHLNFVPEKHTDFAFALWAEETGFVGSAILIALFLALIWCLMLMAWRSRSVFARLTIAGVATLLFLHVFVNIAMVVGVAPVVGVPLPLVSYGGTSLFSLMFGLGLAMGLAGTGEVRRLAFFLGPRQRH